MATATSSTACPADAWTAVGAGTAAIVQVQNDTGAPAAFRIAAGASAPSNATDGILVAANGNAFVLTGMSAATNVYVRPANGAAVAKVIAT